MKTTLSILIGLMLGGEAFAETPVDEKPVREVVQSFYAAFNSHGWTHAANYTTEDWNHINPGGGWTRGRAAVLKELEEVHTLFERRLRCERRDGRAACECGRGNRYRDESDEYIHDARRCQTRKRATHPNVCGGASK